MKIAVLDPFAGDSPAWRVSEATYSVRGAVDCVVVSQANNYLLVVRLRISVQWFSFVVSTYLSTHLGHLRSGLHSGVSRGFC